MHTWTLQISQKYVKVRHDIDSNSHEENVLMKGRGKKTKKIILISQIMQFWFEIMKDFKSNLHIIATFYTKYCNCT